MSVELALWLMVPVALGFSVGFYLRLVRGLLDAA